MPKKAPCFPIAENELKELRSIVKKETIDARTYKRARILLLKHEGNSIKTVMDKLDISETAVLSCLRKYEEGGLETVFSDKKGRGRKPEISDDAKAWIISTACEKPTESGYSSELWFPRLLRDHIRKNAVKKGYPRLQNVSTSTIRSILENANIKPHKIRYYCEKKDPDFDKKMHDVLVVYKQLELFFDEEGNLKEDELEKQGLHVISYDEKPGIQALATVADDRPPVPGTDKTSTVQRDYEYVRLGTLSLLAGIDLQTGRCIPVVSESHKSADFVSFLKKLDSLYPAGDRIRLILDNHSAHTSQETQRYLNETPDRFEFVFTPTHGSWLNLVEGFFSKMTRQMLSGIRVNSKEELAERLYRYFNEVNAEPVPYRWKYRMDTINLENENIQEIIYETVNKKAADKLAATKRTLPPKKYKKTSDKKG